MDDPDAKLPHFDHATPRQQLLKCPFVDIAVHGGDGRELRQLLEHGNSDEIAGMHDQVRRGELAQACIRQPPPTARQVRVGDDRYSNSETRSGFIADSMLTSGRPDTAILSGRYARRR